MLISPPFLPVRQQESLDSAFLEQAMPPSATNCPGTSVPEGSFPISLRLGWHGGVHIRAPSDGKITLPVRCIADGEVVYARKPVPRTTEASHPQNYNPYGDSAAWTDSGMVIVRHTSDVGAGDSAKEFVFYSLVTHLSELTGNVLKVASGTATSAQRKIYRKDKIGVAGRIYGVADHVHFEIVCDDTAMEKFVGRQSGGLKLDKHGRTDAVYGEVYFLIPSGTSFYSDRPPATVSVPTAAASFISSTVMVVGISFGSGSGPYPGDALVSSYHLNGEIIGSGSMRDPDAEYNLISRAAAIRKEYEAIKVATVPSESALYELLRFGRVIGPDALVPAKVPYWCRVNLPSGTGWVNLNADAILKYSDADFPDWKGWTLVNDDTDSDSRCNSKTVLDIISKADPNKRILSRTALEKQLSTSTVRNLLSGAIAKFPSEWNRELIDARWGWLKNDPEYGIKSEDWSCFRDHINALTVPASELPPELRASHWHFHPCRFIEQARKCSWLSESEMAQTLPKYMFYTGSGTPRTANTSAAFSIDRQEAIKRLSSHHVSLNKCLRKYIGSGKQRTALFLAQVILETAQWRNLGKKCRLMHEWYFGQPSTANPATVHYSAFYGRGIMQLTWAGNYKKYGEYRALPDHTGPYVERLTPESPRITATSKHYDANPNDRGKLFVWSPRYDPDLIGEDAYAACDSGGHYWITKPFSGNININRACDRSFSVEIVGLVNRLVNGGGNGYYERQAYSAYLMRFLTEDTATEATVSISLPSPRTNIVVDYSKA